MSDDTDIAEVEEVDAPETEETVEVAETVETVEAKTDEPGSLLADAEGDGDGGDKPASVVPDEYKFEPSEGFEVNDQVQEQLDAFSQTAKDAGLSQEQYQRVVTGEIDRQMASVNQANEAYGERLNQWVTETKSDNELGGDKLQENLGQAKSAVDRFGTPGLKELFEPPSPDNPSGLGIGNHPEIIRLLHRVGGMLKEDDLVGSDTEVADQTDGLKRMYPSMFAD